VAARFSLIWGAAGDDGDPTWKERGRQLRPPLSSSVTSCRAPRYAPELPLRRDIERGRRARARCVHGGRPSRGARNRGVCQLLCGVEQRVWRVLLPSCGARLLSWTWRVSSVWLPVGRPSSPGKQRNSRISEAFLCDKHSMSMIDLASCLGCLGRLGWVIRPAPCAAIFA
jgi:hypothetical protein